MNQIHTTRETRRTGFTLIELLVVISIIALLVGILLPALGAARRSAQSAVCLGNQRSIGQAVSIYAAENRDWLPGPETSGWEIGNAGGSADRATDPTQNMDWMSPLFGNSLGLPDDPEERVQAIFADEFRCPSNDITYDTAVAWSGPNIDGLPYASYSAALGFHFYNSNEASIHKGLTSQARAIFDSPRGYAPKVDRVGPPSNKIWTLEGNRFWSGTQLSYNGYERQIQGGNFMEYGPAVQWADGPFSTSTKEEDMLRLAFRHNGSMNNSYFDGHGSGLKPDDAKPPSGDTLESLSPWFPTGTLVGGGASGTLP